MTALTQHVLTDDAERRADLAYNAAFLAKRCALGLTDEDLRARHGQWPNFDAALNLAKAQVTR